MIISSALFPEFELRPTRNATRKYTWNRPARIQRKTSCLRGSLFPVGSIFLAERQRIADRRTGARRAARSAAEGSTMVAVGPPVSRRPPHRSQQAELPHWAPASGDDDQAAIGRPSCPGKLLLQPYPVLCPATGLLARIPLGPLPSLHRLRRRLPHTHFVRRLLRYYGSVRLPVSVHRRRAP